MAKPMEPISLENVLLSFTQQGIFLDKSFMHDARLSEGDVVLLKLLTDERELMTKTYTKVRSKGEWNVKSEMKAYGDRWYSTDIVDEFLKEKGTVILGYFEWDLLTYDLVYKKEYSKRSLVDGFLGIEKMPKVKLCRKMRILIPTEEEVPELKKQDLILPQVAFEKSKMIMWVLDEESRRSPIDKERAALSTLPGVGQKRRDLLYNRGIKNIFDLVSSPTSKLAEIKGFSSRLVRKLKLSASKVLEPSAETYTAEVFLTIPRNTIVRIGLRTKVSIIKPFYSHIFVREHPQVEAKVLSVLSRILGETFEVMMPVYTTIRIEKKDGTQKILMRGPWVIEMVGFSDEKGAKKTLDSILWSIQEAFDLWYDKDVFCLIKPQKRPIDADQILERLTEQFSLKFSEPESILEKFEERKKSIVDTNVLIDGRLSSLIVKAYQGILEEEFTLQRPEVVVPNIVSFEIKSLIDRYRAKESQYYLGDMELRRLRALHDAGFITLKYVGEVPLVPPVAESEKGKLTFIGSIRDEHILEALRKVGNSFLVTSDGRLARSAYVRGYEVVLVKPLKKEVADNFSERLKHFELLSDGEKKALLKEISRKAKVPYNTALKTVELLLST